MASQRIKTRKVQTKDQQLTLMSIFQIFWGNKSKCNYATVLYEWFFKTQLGHWTKNGTANSERVARTF